MEKKIANNDFVEHAEFSGNMYGTRWVFRPNTCISMTLVKVMYADDLATAVARSSAVMTDSTEHQDCQFG